MNKSPEFALSAGSDEQLEIFPELKGFQRLEISGDLLDSVLWRKTHSRFGKYSCIVRNLCPRRVLHELPGASGGVRQDFFRLFSSRCEIMRQSNIHTAVLAPDIECAIGDPEYCGELKKLLCCCFGIAYKNDIQLQIELRIPGMAIRRPDAFLRFIRNLLFPVRVILDFHPHEPESFALLSQAMPALPFARGICRISFEAAAGNYLNDATIRKIAGTLRPDSWEVPLMIFAPGSDADIESCRELAKLAAAFSASDRKG